MRLGLIAVLVVSVLACSRSDSSTRSSADSVASTRPDSAHPLAVAVGFSQPEAVRYDPDQDVYFVSNWGPGAPDAKDNNAFISRMAPDGVVQQLKFIVGGTGGVTLHAPRGMTIVGDTLWVVDADAVRGFNRHTGAPLATADFSAFKLGFLNDIAAGPDGLYITDTGTNDIYRVSAGKVTLALNDSGLGGPNGITWDAAGRRFIVVPYGGESVIKSWVAGSKTLKEIGRSTGSKFDGVEVLPGNRILVSAQKDSSLYLFSAGNGRPIIHTGGDPADIAVDTKRNRAAVPFVSRSLIEIWQLPSQ
jgi:sugar lactone lactonase YvrE